MEDSALAAAAAKGDERAFTIIVERYRRYLYAIAYRIVLNEDEALDAVQNALAQAARRIGDYRGEGPLRGWLATIAARQALDLARRRPAEVAVEPETLARLAERQGGGEGEGAREALERRERRERVAAAMRELSPQQRAIFELRFLESMGPKEIAERLGLPASQVRTQLTRAVVRLREIVMRKGGARE